MNIPSEPPYDWAKSVEAALLKHDDIPLLGGATPFPWQEFAALLSRNFEREDLTVTPSELRWRSEDELLSGLGENHKMLHVAISSLEGTICWAMPENDLAELLSHLVSEKPRSTPYHHADLLEGFHHFLAIEVLFIIDNLRYLKDLTLHLAPQAELPPTPALTMDVSIKLKDKSLWGRLFLPTTFYQSWKQHFVQQKASTLSPDILAQLDVTVGMLVGKTELTMDQWSRINAGDIILLDSCSLDPETKRGPVSITVNGYPAIRGELTDQGVLLGGGGAAPSSRERAEAVTEAPPPAEEAPHPPAEEEAHPPAQEEGAAIEEEEEDDDFDLDDDDLDFDDDDFDLDDLDDI